MPRLVEPTVGRSGNYAGSLGGNATLSVGGTIMIWARFETTRIRWSLIGRSATIGLVLACSAPANAAEGALGFYLLGSKTTMAGYLPGPGIYGSLSNYGYSGSANIDYQNAGVTVSGNIDAKPICLSQPCCGS